MNYDKDGVPETLRWGVVLQKIIRRTQAGLVGWKQHRGYTYEAELVGYLVIIEPTAIRLNIDPDFEYFMSYTDFPDDVRELFDLVERQVWRDWLDRFLKQTGHLEL